MEWNGGYKVLPLSMNSIVLFESEQIKYMYLFIESYTAILKQPLKFF